MEPDIVRADPQYRRKAWLVLGVATVLAVLCVLGFARWLQAWSQAMALELLVARLRVGAAAAVLAAAVCLLLLAAQAAVQGRRVLDAGRWPLPGARLLQDRRIRRGPAARRIGRSLQGVAVLVTLTGLAAGLVGLRLVLVAL